MKQTVLWYLLTVQSRPQIRYGEAKYITNGKDGFIAHFMFMYRCYSSYCHSSDTPIVKKEVK